MPKGIGIWDTNEATASATILPEGVVQIGTLCELEDGSKFMNYVSFTALKLIH